MHDTNRRITKDRTGPDLDERPHYFSMAPIRAILTEKSIRFSAADRGQKVSHYRGEN